MICEDAVQQILSQPRDEMSIVQLLNADPMIREFLLRKPQPEITELQSQDSIDSIEEESEEMDEDSASVDIVDRVEVVTETK